MGKKSRAVPGRRPILQLSPPGPRSSTPGRDPDPDPDPEADSTAAATSQSAPAAATAAAATSPAVPASAAPEDSPSEDEQEVVVEVPNVVQNPPTPVMTTRPTAVKATGRDFCCCFCLSLKISFIKLKDKSVQLGCWMVKCC
ncbi:formin-binding protein 4 isoform 5 [Mus musculus]|uniref:formin-binding protein 4 isoform 5 n=1 Tax=Mus musculus TaxID=10090 RepID=UPI0024B15325|nr:formin-binding protein 4 isoform 5 [Mus musculus]